MNSEEIRLRIFEAIYEIGGDWTAKEQDFAEGVYSWIKKQGGSKAPRTLPRKRA